jgi:aspartate carbamoyltransferase regulatory subunit
MTEPELARFRDRLKIDHIATADTDNSGVTPYTQDIPFQARQTYLDSIRGGIYEDFGGLDVHTIAAGATNDHIDAAYQPLDENADDFEYQIIKFVQQILALMGIEDTPVFKRNRISNQMEQVQIVSMEAQWLDDETILQKLPNISVDEITSILQRKGLENQNRFSVDVPEFDKEEEQTEGTEENMI